MQLHIVGIFYIFASFDSFSLTFSVPTSRRLCGLQSSRDTARLHPQAPGRGAIGANVHPLPGLGNGSDVGTADRRLLVHGTRRKSYHIGNLNQYLLSFTFTYILQYL